MFEWIDWIVAVLIDLELSLYRSMGRNLQRHGLDEERHGFRWTQWQAVQLRGLRRFRRKLAREVDIAFDEILPEIDKNIELAYRSGEQTFDNAIVSAHNAGIALSPVSVDSFADVHEERLKTVIMDVRTDIDKARYGAAQRAGAIYEDIIKRADVAFQTGSMTLLDSVEHATKDAAKQGLNAIEYEDGKRVNISSYVEMALRTSARRAANEAEGVKREQWGIFTVISPTLHSTCDTCQPWQGRVLIDDVFSKGEADGKHPMLSEAMKAPSHFQGPNCRHPLTVYIPGVTQIPKQSDFDQTKSNYEAEQQQRYIERKIREWKRQEALSVNKDEKAKAALKVKTWQAAMREHLRHQPQLRRNPQREKLLD